jgi:hypothetical protein
MDQTIKNTKNLLDQNPAWINSYDGYANNIKGYIKNIKLYRSLFNQFKPLYFYISTTNAIKAKNNLVLDVRYMGQSVATLKANQKNISISTKAKDVNNLRDFNCNIQLNNISWTDPLTSAFRKFFKGRPISRNTASKKRNDEHHVESLLLIEFSKKVSTNKQITGIQPIKISEIRFPMPTPLTASNNNLVYSGSSGGNIDILARTGHGKATYLTIIEVKDENKPTEPPIVAIKQAIKYGVFIRELLRSNCGDKWYEIFGFKGKIPASLKIRVVCAMPDDIFDDSFTNQPYPIGNDIIECHYIYFKYVYDNNKNIIDLSNFQTSL